MASVRGRRGQREAGGGACPWNCDLGRGVMGALSVHWGFIVCLCHSFLTTTLKSQV